MPFAAQAAAVIDHARAYRDHRHARADLGALVYTSPVGVAVFGASTGGPVPLNHEEPRIVEIRRAPGRPAEDLPQTKCLAARRTESPLPRLGLNTRIATTPLSKASSAP